MVGLIDLHTAPSLGPLTTRRSIASVSFLGRYCIMDFTLSNMTNSDIDYMGILAKGNIRSLSKHIGSGSSWRFNTKTSKVQFLYNEPAANMLEYNTDVANILENWWFIEESRAQYILFAPAHILHRMDYGELLADHIKNKARCTLVYTPVNFSEVVNRTCTFVSLNEKDIITNLSDKPDSKKNALLNMGIVLMNKDFLLEVLNKCQKTSKFFNIVDLFEQDAIDFNIHGYQYKGDFYRIIDSFYEYYKASLEALDVSVAAKLFSPSWPLFTKSFDTPPAIYGESSNIVDSYVANGAEINGTVKHSILGRGVVVEKGAELENCIVLSGCHIYPNTHLTNVILDNEASVRHTKFVEGKPTFPVYVKRGDQI